MSEENQSTANGEEGFKAVPIKTLGPVPAKAPGSLSVRIVNACAAVGLEVDAPGRITSVRIGRRAVAAPLEGEDWSIAVARDGHVPANTYVTILVTNEGSSEAVLTGRFVVANVEAMSARAGEPLGPAHTAEILDIDGRPLVSAGAPDVGTREAPRTISVQANVGGGARRSSVQSGDDGRGLGSRAGPRVVRGELGDGSSVAEPGRARSVAGSGDGEIGTRESPHVVRGMISKAHASAHRTVRTSEVKVRFAGTVRDRHQGARTMVQGPHEVEPTGAIVPVPPPEPRQTFASTTTDLALAAGTASERLVALDRGAARQLLRLVAQRLPLEGGFAQAITRALSAGLAFEGSRAWGQNEIVIALSPAQIHELRQQILAGPFRALPERDQIAAAIRRGFEIADAGTPSALDKGAALPAEAAP